MATSTTKKPHTNDDRAQAMLLWARKNRFAVHGVTVGDVTITCTDLGPPPTAPSRKTTPEEKSVYAAYGGDAWEKAQAGSEGRDPDDPESDEDEDDDEPPR